MTFCSPRWWTIVGAVLVSSAWLSPAAGQNRPAGPVAGPPQSYPQAGQPTPGVQPGAQQSYPQAGYPAQPTASRQGVPLPPRVQQPPQAPFQLSPQQQADLMAVLRAWEEKSDGIKLLYCDFVRWDYDAVFGQRNPDPKNPQLPGAIIPRESHGELKYAAPDKGLYHIKEIKEYKATVGGKKEFVTRTDGGEHWICDGLAIWEYNFEKKQLIERKLPPELQGKAITDGPLPFLFGAQAGKLMQRYFLRIATPDTVKGQIWLEAYPRFQFDAANFQRATMILDQKTFWPFALEVILPNAQANGAREKSRHVHQFQNHLVNDPLRIFKADFSKPDLPRGWTKLDDNPRTAPGPTAQGTPPVKR